MCGLFGFVGSGPDIEQVRTCAALAGRRGPHAWGVAWIAAGVRSLYREPQAFARSRWDLGQLAGAQALIGHCRLSTSGPPADNANNQPLAVGAVAVAHNGNVYGHHATAQRAGFALRTTCDSELLAHLADRDHKPDNVIAAVGSAPFALLVLDHDQLWTARRRLPLYALVRPEGTYFCSWPLGGGALAEDSVALYRVGDPHGRSS